MRLLARAALVGALLCGLTACSDKGDDGDPGGRPGDGTTTLALPDEAAKGEQVDVDAFVTALEESFAAGSGARVAFEVRGAATVVGRGVVSYREGRMDVDLRIADWQVDGGWVLLRTTGGSAYLQVPESRGLWVDIGPDETGLADEVLEGADPRDQLAAYRDEVTEVRFSGDEVIRGTATRRYQVVVDDEVTEYWLDPHLRVVRRSSDLGSGTATFSWLDWDAPVDIVAPSASELITLRQLERLRRAAERPDRRDGESRRD